MFNKIYEELKAVPVTMILLALLYIAVVALYKDHVSSLDFNSLRDQIWGVQYTLRVDHLDSRMHQVESELFQLNNSVLEKQLKHLDVDQIYYRRIDELKNEDDAIKRELIQAQQAQLRNPTNINSTR